MSVRNPSSHRHGLAYCGTEEAVEGIAEVARGTVAGIVAAVVGKAGGGIAVVPAPCSTYLPPRHKLINCTPSFLSAGALALSMPLFGAIS